MNLTMYRLEDYCHLLTTKNLLAAPLPAGLDLSRTVELVSYDSKNVVPGTLFLPMSARPPTRRWTCPASRSPTCARSSPPLPFCTTTTPPGC